MAVSRKCQLETRTIARETTEANKLVSGARLNVRWTHVAHGSIAAGAGRPAGGQCFFIFCFCTDVGQT